MIKNAQDFLEDVPAPSHDDLIKRLLHRPRLLKDFFRAFLPEVARFADLDAVEYLDKEHPRGKRSPRRSGDVLIKTRWSRKEAAFLIHIESQNKVQDIALERLVEYAMRDSIRYKMPVLPVLPVLLLTYNEPKKPVSGELLWEFGKVANLHLTCPVLHFQRMDPRPYLRSKNVSALALTALMPLNKNQQVQGILQTLAEALRQHLGPEDLEAAVDFVQFYTELEDAQVLQFEEQAAKISHQDPNLVTMPKLVNNWARVAAKRALSHGISQGISQGLVQGQLRVTQRLLQKKFPRVAKKAGRALSTFDEEKLLCFADALLFMQNEKECLQWLSDEK